MGDLVRQHVRLVSFFVLSIFLRAQSIAQPPSRRLIDSLQHALATSRSDNQRIQLLTLLSGNYFGIKPDSGMLLGRKAIDLAIQSKRPQEEAEARMALAACLWGVGQHLQAIDEYRSVIPIAEQSRNRKLQARIHHGIAINYGAIDKKETAIAYLKKSLALQIQDRNDSGAMGCYHNLAHYSAALNQQPEALSYYEQALIYAQRAGHQRGIAFTHIRLSELNGNLGNEVVGLKFQEQAFDRFKQLRDTVGMAECWAVRGQINRLQKNFAEAISCYQQAIRLQRLVHGQYFQRQLGGYWIDLATVYQEAPKTGTTEQLAKEAWSNALNIGRATNDWGIGAKSAQALSELYRNRKQPEEALRYFVEYIRYRDSATNLEKEKQNNLHELQTRYNDSIADIKKLQEKQVLIIRQESALREARITQTRLYALVVVAMLALVLSILLYRNRIQKLRFRNEIQLSAQEQERKSVALQKQIREATLSALQAQMNPHFIFNSLNVIQSFVYAGDKEQASRLIGTFSELVRQTLQFSRSALISLEEELSFIRSYTELEANRMGADLSIRYQIDSQLNLKSIQLPPLLIQPFVENALRHGLYHKEGLRQLTIHVSGTNDSVCIEVDDNGIGRTAAKTYASQADHLSFSTGANAERMALMNQFGNRQVELQIIDKTAADGSSDGTTVRIHITQNTNPETTAYESHSDR